jgi:putative SOS response-associated peptidase YedK
MVNKSLTRAAVPATRPMASRYRFTRLRRAVGLDRGLWDAWKDIETGERTKSCTMIITQANALVGEVHDRMPVILETGDVDAWLTGGAGTPQGGAKLEQTLLVNKGKLVSRSLAISAPADTKQPRQLGNRRSTFPRRRAVNQIANADRDVGEVVAAWIKLSWPGA